MLEIDSLVLLSFFGSVGFKIAIGVAVVALIYFVGKWYMRPAAWQTNPQQRAFEEIKRDPDLITHDGHQVWYVKGVAQDMPMDEMDRGVEHTFKKGECAGYPVDRTRHHVKIVVLESEQAPKSGNWCFKTPIERSFSGYFDTDWDVMKGQGGDWHYILAAEQVVAIGNPYGDVFCLPYVPASEPDKNYIARLCEYSMEHIILAYYDGAKDNATKDHSKGPPHPLIAECPDGTEL